MSKINAFTANEFAGTAGFLVVVQGEVNCGSLDVQPSLTENTPRGLNPNVLLLTVHPASDQQPETFRKVHFSKNEKFQGEYDQVQLVDPAGGVLQTLPVVRQTHHQSFTEKQRLAKIYRVETVTLQILKTHPTVLFLQAAGQVSSSGWKNGKLIPYVYVKPPADGLYEFDFVAEQPTGITFPVLLPISAEGHWEDFPPDLKGVKIYASSNSVVAMVSNAREVTMQEGGGGGNPHGLFRS